jgi:iron complex transport system permease protein
MTEMELDIKRYTSIRILILILAFVLLLVLTGVGITIGSSSLSWHEIVNTFTGKGTLVSEQIIYRIRLPRVIAAIATGLALAVSGSAIQTVIRNPLGSPYTLGLSAAAAFGASFAIVILGALTSRAAGLFASIGQNPYILTLSAFLFSMICAAIIMGFARWKGASPTTLIMAGIILTSLFGSATSFLQYLSDELELSMIISWMFGDLGKATWQKCLIQIVISLPAWFYFLFNSWNFNALNAGDEAAMSLGVKTGRIRLFAILVASLCTAVAVAFYGIIAFVGLVIPHITRWLLGNDEQYVILGAGLLGAVFLLLSDIMARTLVSPIVIPVGILTSFVGAPFFLFLLIRNIHQT